MMNNFKWLFEEHNKEELKRAATVVALNLLMQAVGFFGAYFLIINFLTS